MPPTPPIPVRGDVDATWLGAALGAPGRLLAVRDEVIGAGQMGTNVRYHLTWADTTPTAQPNTAPTAQPNTETTAQPNTSPTAQPHTVIGKFPSDDPRSLATAQATKAYHREIGFYQDLRTALDVAAPRSWYAELDDASGRFVLVLDDLAPAVPGDQLAGCSADQARQAMAAIATLHAPSWGLTQSPVTWLDMPGVAWRQTRIELYRGVFDGFASHFASLLSDDDLHLGRQLGDRLEEYYAAFTTPWCVTHGDFRLDNILFDADRAWLVDWQTLSIGHGPADVGYFMATGFDDELRGTHLDALIGYYCDALETHGLVLDAATRDAIIKDVHVGAASGYLMAVIASQIVEQTDRGDAMFAAMARRSAAYLRDSAWWQAGPLR